MTGPWPFPGRPGAWTTFGNLRRWRGGKVRSGRMCVPWALAAATETAGARKKARRRLFVAGASCSFWWRAIGLVSASRGGGEIDPRSWPRSAGRHRPLRGGHRQDRAPGQGRGEVEGQRHREEARRRLRRHRARRDRCWSSWTKETLSGAACARRGRTSSRRRPPSQRTRCRGARARILPFLKSSRGARAPAVRARASSPPTSSRTRRRSTSWRLNKRRAALSNVSVNAAEVARAQAMLERADTDLRQLHHREPDGPASCSRATSEVGDAVSSILVARLPGHARDDASAT